MKTISHRELEPFLQKVRQRLQCPGEKSHSQCILAGIESMLEKAGVKGGVPSFENTRRENHRGWLGWGEGVEDGAAGEGERERETKRQRVREREREERTEKESERVRKKCR